MPHSGLTRLSYMISRKRPNSVNVIRMKDYRLIYKIFIFLDFKSNLRLLILLFYIKDVDKDIDNRFEKICFFFNIRMVLDLCQIHLNTAVTL